MDTIRLVVVGDLFVDVSVHGGPGHASRISVRAGGTAANLGVWAVSLGAHVVVVSRVGDDLGGRGLLAALEERGVGAAVSTDPGAATGTFLLLGTDRHVDRGANAALAPEHLPKAIEADVVAVSPYVEPATAQAVVQRARAPWIVALGKPLLGANAVVLNELEAEEGVHELAERFRLACVTLGELGALAVLDGEEASATAPPVATDDSTGAGDAFAAGLVVSVARGAGLADALAEGCRLGAASAASPTGWPVVK